MPLMLFHILKRNSDFLEIVIFLPILQLSRKLFLNKKYIPHNLFAYVLFLHEGNDIPFFKKWLNQYISAGLGIYL